jgi:cell division protein FtsI/penicillin-binding protein 2
MMLRNKVGVSKKSLDDYLLQLRFGKKLGFDFEKYKNERVGVLRKFVKQNKSWLK